MLSHEWRLSLLRNLRRAKGETTPRSLQRRKQRIAACEVQNNWSYFDLSRCVRASRWRITRNTTYGLKYSAPNLEGAIVERQLFSLCCNIKSVVDRGRVCLYASVASGTRSQTSNRFKRIGEFAMVRSDCTSCRVCPAGLRSQPGRAETVAWVKSGVGPSRCLGESV
jgi:hypothetical protein